MGTDLQRHGLNLVFENPHSVQFRVSVMQHPAGKVTSIGVKMCTSNTHMLSDSLDKRSVTHERRDDVALVACHEPHLLGLFQHLRQCPHGAVQNDIALTRVPHVSQHLPVVAVRVQLPQCHLPVQRLHQVAEPYQAGPVLVQHCELLPAPRTHQFHVQLRTTGVRALYMVRQLTCDDFVN